MSNNDDETGNRKENLIPETERSSDTNGETFETEMIEVKPSSSSPNKRNYLEIGNNLEKYKSFMLKSQETKRFKPSDALLKVKEFLPILKSSTDQLLTQFKDNPDQVNIENVEDEDEHIEMNLALVSDSDDDEDSDEYDEIESEEDEGSSDEDKESNESDEEEAEKTEEENKLDQLNLGFKVKVPSQQIKIFNSKKSKKPNLISVLHNTTDEDKHIANAETEPNGSN
jgi:hypothetical protein